MTTEVVPNKYKVRLRGLTCVTQSAVKGLILRELTTKVVPNKYKVRLRGLTSVTQSAAKGLLLKRQKADASASLGMT